MTQFWKRPKFWVNLVLIVWLAYLIGSNIGLSVPLHLVPLLAIVTVQVSTILFGVVGMLWVQFLWRRWRSSNQAPQSTAAPGSSRSTAA